AGLDFGVFGYVGDARFVRPMFELVTLLERVEVPFFSAYRVLLAVFFTMPLVAALSPGLLIATREGSFLRAITRLPECDDPAVQHAVATMRQNAGVRAPVRVVLAAGSSAVVQELHLRKTPLLFVLSRGFLRPEGVIVVDELLLDQQSMPREWLAVALA